MSCQMPWLLGVGRGLRAVINFRISVACLIYLSTDAIGLVVFMERAWAAGGPSPYLSGISVGAEAGALPPPGFYGALDTFYAGGAVMDNSGRKLPIRGLRVETAPAVLWVPSLELLGARFGMSAVGQLIWQRLDASRVGGDTMVSFGFSNPFVSPINLSYKLPEDFYVKFGLGFFLPLGDYTRQGNRESPNSIANRTWTIEPDFGVSWLRAGWNLSAHAILDFQTKDEVVKYRSGNIFYLDLTATKTVAPWTFGVGGNYTQQYTDDYQNGIPVNGNGNRLHRLLVGPVASYNFSKFNLKILGLYGIRARNDVNLSFVHVVGSVAF